jgi:methionine synthase I (cobalamin-dependent)
MSFDRVARIRWLKEEARRRVLLLDGSWGVMIQGYGLQEDDFRADRFATHNHDLKGNNLGPTNRTASISPDVNNPGFRAVTFDRLDCATPMPSRSPA